MDETTPLRKLLGDLRTEFANAFPFVCEYTQNAFSDEAKQNWANVFKNPRQDFQWSPKTPLSDWHIMPVTWAIYFFVIFSIQALMRNRKAFTLTFVSAVHNIILCVWSAVMFAGLVYDMFLKAKAGTIQDTFCEASGAAGKGGIFFWLYIYYLSKFYELFDTVIMVLKKKRLNFLHVYHHSIVIAMVWSWLEGSLIFASWGMAFNTAIHVFMYLYYFLATLGIHPFWKSYLTRGQIVQFLCSFMLMLRFGKIHTHKPHLDLDSIAPSVWPVHKFISSLVTAVKYEPLCAGASWLWFTAGCNLSFLILFMRFYQRTYDDHGRPRFPRVSAARTSSKELPSPSPSAPTESTGAKVSAAVATSTATGSAPAAPAAASPDLSAEILRTLLDMRTEMNVLKSEVMMLKAQQNSNMETRISDIVTGALSRLSGPLPSGPIMRPATPEADRPAPPNQEQ